MSFCQRKQGRGQGQSLRKSGLSINLPSTAKTSSQDASVARVRHTHTHTLGQPSSVGGLYMISRMTTLHWTINSRAHSLVGLIISLPGAINCLYFSL